MGLKNIVTMYKTLERWVGANSWRGGGGTVQEGVGRGLGWHWLGVNICCDTLWQSKGRGIAI